MKGGPQGKEDGLKEERGPLKGKEDGLKEESPPRGKNMDDPLPHTLQTKG